jgi:hypothetical protein
VLSEELKLQSIDSKFGYGILDKNNKLTSISNNTYLDQKDKKIIRIRFLQIKMTRRFLLFHWFSQKRCFFGKKQFAYAIGNIYVFAYHFRNLYYLY